MPSKAFLNYKAYIPTAPPQPGQMPHEEGNAIPVTPLQGGPNAYPGAELGLPMMPPDYVPPEPVIPEGCTGGKVTVGGVLGLHITMPGLREKCALLYLHGGGFTIGSAMTGGPLLKLFAQKVGLEGYAVEYGLAPYHPFPEAVEDCVAFYQGLLDMGYEKIIMGGESAGAGLTLSVTLALKERKLPLPVALWCSSPVEDLSPAGQNTYMKDFLLDSTEKLLQAYAPGVDPKHPLLSPIYGDFAGMPPMILQAGGGESLAAGTVRLAEKAARANCEVVLHVGKDMPHTFAMDYECYPEAADAMEEILTFVRNQLALTEL